MAEAINAAFSAARIPISMCHRFSCECDKDKQRWIHTVLSSGSIFFTGKGEDDSKESFSNSKRKESEDDFPTHGCIFADIQELEKGESALCCAQQRVHSARLRCLFLWRQLQRSV